MHQAEVKITKLLSAFHFKTVPCQVLLQMKSGRFLDLTPLTRTGRLNTPLHLSPDVNHGHPRFDPAPDIRANLPMGLSRLPEVAPHLLIGPVQGSLLFTGGPPCCTAPARRQTGEDTQTHTLTVFSLYKHSSAVVSVLMLKQLISHKAEMKANIEHCVSFCCPVGAKSEAERPK